LQIVNVRLDRIDRGKRSPDHACSGMRMLWQQGSMCLRYLEHDGCRFNRGEIAFFIGNAEGK
jgi:hypothetical protein